MEDRLKREEWDFSNLSTEELIPALLWETKRESVDIDRIAIAARALLAGKLSTKKLPMPRDKRTGKRPRHNFNSSEADKARIQAMAAFDDFIPIGEYRWLEKLDVKQKLLGYNRWFASYLRPILENYKLPWCCLPKEERSRLCNIFENGRNANIVNIGSWCDAVYYFKRHKLDGGLPLKFDYSEYTSVLLTINWRNSNKQILAAIGKLLQQCEPADMTRIKRWNRRGKKDRDILVMLERLALMRLLHHYTLSEVKRLLPDAWSRYQNRKWYDERRRALKDFRDVFGCYDADFFPRSWLTKAHRLRKAPQLPTK